MKISNRFTIAVHTILLVEYFKGQYKTTSDFIASSVKVNPVIIRQILGQLKKAGLVEVQAGSGGATLLKTPEEITLYDIFYAVEALDNNKLFGFHENPNKECPVGKNIHNVLDDKLTTIQNSMDKELKNTTIKDLIKNIK